MGNFPHTHQEERKKNDSLGTERIMLKRVTMRRNLVLVTAGLTMDGMVATTEHIIQWFPTIFNWIDNES